MAQTADQTQLRVVNTTATQYVQSLTKMKESLPPFSEKRRTFIEHILTINEFQRMLQREF